jgi:hypothetical protein
MASRPKSAGFGFVPAESEHHFLVMIPSQTHEPIYIDSQKKIREPEGVGE